MVSITLQDELALDSLTFFGCSCTLQPVVDAFDPRLLVAPAISHVINFTSIKVLLENSFCRL